ncbi:phage terminase large subunit-like protein [Sinorhizobium medicae]|uniref:terminase large subunit n=1 Tax=Sinorhizobium medicae TaxID=110321 RepID=UPI00119D1898|nr:terminase TerL endonuclease subunit [Sinorhizobium medicae]MDX0512559.1 terminase large subunit [Sinorhizobium medicae]MDX0870564.1 terminase large subunit [Sinorhizobium medicae]MDX0925358.1 terminase large subunit [Sinorhizobium medicae]MDX0937285.1 terminase large subunit [Sinorhizobium medicae]MDX0943553.1 terminase large subunit [Sinorhizobium medicae]
MEYDIDAEKYPHVAAGYRYAVDVVGGRIPACEYVQQACQRQLDDIARSISAEGWLYYFDHDAAERVCKFTCFLPHIKGPLAGQNLTLESWQSFILTAAFGWLRHDNGKRRFRRAYTEVPRGNGKTTLSDGPALYCGFGEKEGGAEVYSAARTRDQAKVAFSAAQAMLRRATALRTALGIDVEAHRIIQMRSNSYFEALSADADSLDGKNVHFALIDELHAHRDRGVYDAIETGAGKRNQSMVWAITTAGADKTGICYEHRAYTINILKGTAQDDTYFGIIYTIDKDDDWTEEATWRKANPNYGISVEPEHIAALCRKAMSSPASQANFLTKHLNVWIQTNEALYDMRAWDRCFDEEIDIEDFVGDPCRIAVDLASKVDIAAVVALFERGDKVYPFARFYVPEQAIIESRNDSYKGWEVEGKLIATPGDVIDIDRIEADIMDMSSRFEVVEVAYDPWQAQQMANHLSEQGANVVEYRQTVQNFSEPTKELDALMRSGKIAHPYGPRDPLSWMIGNVVGHYDAKENVYPRKERPENKIDGAIALIMNLGLHLRSSGGAQAPSPWEDPNFKIAVV